MLSSDVFPKLSSVATKGVIKQSLIVVVMCFFQFSVYGVLHFTVSIPIMLQLTSFSFVV